MQSVFWKILYVTAVALVSTGPFIYLFHTPSASCFPVVYIHLLLFFLFQHILFILFLDRFSFFFFFVDAGQLFLEAEQKNDY